MLRQSACVQECSDSLQNRPISPFGNTIVLWGVMDGEFAYRSRRIEMLSKFITQIFSASIRTKDFDGSIVLGLHLRLVGFVGGEGFGLEFLEIDLSRPMLVIRVRGVVFAATQARNRCWTPNIGMDFSSCLGCAFAVPDF
jgi:hypothetical protein